MLKKILAPLALLVACLVPVSVAGPAEAGTLCNLTGICGSLRHSSPDHGYDAPITATCDLGNPWANITYVYEGQNAGCKDTDGFWVNYGTVIRCTFSGDGYGTVTYHYTGDFVKIRDNANFKCVSGTD
jgi:hypothetical protein